ncbi:MAG: hypothetical protein IIC70_13150 [Acidobacteria bacterium]|nr:hypothetical protein [Acidobacteriota bacterium]
MREWVIDGVEQVLTDVSEGLFDLVLQELELLLKLLDCFIHDLLLSGEDAGEGCRFACSPTGSPLWLIAGTRD